MKVIVERTLRGGALYYQRRVLQNSEDCLVWVTDPRFAHIFFDDKDEELAQVVKLCAKHKIMTKFTEAKRLLKKEEMVQAVQAEIERNKTLAALEKKRRKSEREGNTFLFIDENGNMKMNRKKRGAKNDTDGGPE